MRTIWGKLAELFKNFQYERYRTSGQTLRVSKTITGIAKAILSQSETAIVKLVLESLRSQGSEPRWVVFDRKSIEVPVRMETSKWCPALKTVRVRWWWHWLLSILQLQPEISVGYDLITAPLMSTSSRLWSQHYEDVYHQVQPILINLVITWIPSLVI